MRFTLACLHCGAELNTTQHVGNAQIEAIEDHLRVAHPKALPAGRQVDFALLLGQVRVFKAAD
jgi:hypothetical protein